MSKEVSKKFDFQRKIRFLSSIPTPRVISVTRVFCLSCTRYRSSQLLWNVIVEYFRFRSAKPHIVGSVIKVLKALGKLSKSFASSTWSTVMILAASKIGGKSYFSDSSRFWVRTFYDFCSRSRLYSLGRNVLSMFYGYTIAPPMDSRTFHENKQKIVSTPVSSAACPRKYTRRD